MMCAHRMQSRGHAGLAPFATKWFVRVAGVFAPLVLTVGLLATPTLAARRSFESPAVRAEILRSVQAPGPLRSTKADSGPSSSPTGAPDWALSTAYSDTWRPRRGPRVTRIYESPVNFRTSTGQWRPIETGLVSGLGGYQNAANTFSLRIPESITAGVGISEAGESLSFTLKGASTTPAEVSGSRASFRSVLPATNLEYLSQATGVEELATLENPSAPAALVYESTTSIGLRPMKLANGFIAFDEADGITRFVVPAPLAFAHDGVGGRRLPMSLTRLRGSWRITVDTGQHWLRSALADSPVVVDPTIKAAASAECTLNDEAPTTASCGSTAFEEGYDSTHQEHHALLDFPLSSIPAGSIIVHAKLGLDVETHSTSTAKAVGIYRVTRPWTTSATWETYDGTHKWTTAGGDYESKGADAVINPSVGKATGYYYWYPTKLVQEWVNGENAPTNEGYPTDGLIVKDETDNKTKNLLKFYGYGFSEDEPYLEVFYAPRGQGYQPQYTIVSTPLTTRSRMGVNVASGDLLLESTDLSIAGVAGLNFTSTRTWNSLDEEASQYGPWIDSNFNIYGAYVYSDGTVAIENPTGGWEVFIPKGEGEYITPPGIKATMCETKSTKCGTLPTGSKYKLAYDESGDFVEFSSEGISKGLHDPYKTQGVISAEYPSAKKTIYVDTHGHKIEEFHEGKEGLTTLDITEIKDVAGSRTAKYKYQLRGSEPQLHEYIDADGNTTTYEYSPGRLLDTIIGPEGSYTKLTYETLEGEHYGRIKEIVRATKRSPLEGSKTTFTYYEGSEVPAACKGTPKATLVKDPEWTEAKGHETLYCATELDEVVAVVDADGHEAKTTYDEYGNVTSITAPPRAEGDKAGVTTLRYGTAGINLGCVVEGTTEVQPKCPEQLKAGFAEDANYEDTTFPYRATEGFSARYRKTSFCYWGTVSGPGACEGHGEGGAGELRRETDSRTSQNEVDYGYTGNGTLSEVEGADGHTTKYEYNSEGDPSAIIAPTGAKIGKETITYDGDERPHVITQCLAETSCATADAVTLTYNGLDQVIEEAYTGPGAAKTFKYEYGPGGELKQIEAPAGTTTYHYDALGRLVKEEQLGAHTLEYGYDAASNLTSFTDAGGTTDFVYNGLNELEALAAPSGTCTGTPVKCTKFVYDADGSLTTTTYPSGASLNYTREPTTGRPLAIEAKNPKGEEVLGNAYTYYETPEEGEYDTPLVFSDTLRTPEGKIRTTYGYDELNRLGSSASTSEPTSYAPGCYIYEYDGEGNRRILEWTLKGATCTEHQTHLDYNTGNELECRMKTTGKETESPCSESATSEIAGYSYDGAGDEKAITGYSESGSTSVGYNDAQQLEGLTSSGGGEEALTYLTSGQATLASIGASSLENSAIGITNQTNTEGTSYYTRTPEGTMVDERLPGGSDYNPVYDAQGDVIGLLNSSGELVQDIRYGPYGENATHEGSLKYSTTNDPFLFKGGYHIEQGDPGEGNIPNGLYEFGERYYDPTVGRWTQPGPEGEGLGFVACDPVNEADASGLKAHETAPGRVGPCTFHSRGEGDAEAGTWTFQSTVYCPVTANALIEITVGLLSDFPGVSLRLHPGKPEVAQSVVLGSPGWEIEAEVTVSSGTQSWTKKFKYHPVR